LIFANTAAPWSAFICGEQGAGKSYTLSCLLENALLEGQRLGVNEKALGGIVFHYDNNASDDAAQLCEAASICSQGVPVQVLALPSNVQAMQKFYRIPGVPENRQPVVRPFLLAEKNLRADHMLVLMGAKTNDALYMSSVKQIVKDMKTNNEAFTLAAFEAHIEALPLSPLQKQPLELRMRLLKSVLYPSAPRHIKELAGRQAVAFDKPGLTIVDLSCPTITESEICSLYQICLSIFLGSRSSNAKGSSGQQGLLIAIDEAHKVCLAFHSTSDAR
jgi:hypothetical protein